MSVPFVLRGQRHEEGGELRVQVCWEGHGTRVTARPPPGGGVTAAIEWAEARSHAEAEAEASG